MLGVDSEIATSALRLWVAAGSAALLLALCLLALVRLRSGSLSAALRAGSVIVTAALGAAMAWAFLSPADLSSRSAERQTLQARADALSAQARVPGSPLACLDAVAGDSLEAACEKALFASPSSVAAAASYVAARLTLLSSISAFASRSGENVDDVAAALRRSLETDRFGFLAHILAIRDGCTSQSCKALAVLHDASRVRANLSSETFDRHLEHYATLWAAMPDGASADAAHATAQANTASAPGPHKMVNIDFPSASSIPAVSIMNPEPTGPVLPGVAAAAASNPNPQPAGSATHHSRRQSSNPSSVAQSASSGSSAPEPIWPEPVPAPPAPQTAAAPVAGAPMQLNPPSTARTQ